MNKNIFFNYLIIVVIIFEKSSPFFILTGPYFIFGFTIFLSLFAYSKGIFAISKRIMILLFFVWFIIIMQTLLYGGISPAAIYKPVIIFFLPYIIYKIQGLDFFRYLVNTIYFFAIFTFPLYLLQSLIPKVNSLVDIAMRVVFPFSWADWPRTLLFYSMPRESGFILMRNSGIYGEPGEYAIFLMLALIINSILMNNPINRKNIIMILILITTFSTVGYILLFLFMLYAVPKSRQPIIMKFVSFIVVILLIFSTYQSAEFLQKKINSQFSDQTYAIEKGNISQGRFFAFLKGFELFRKNPVFGKGILTANDPLEEDFNSSAFGWGFMGFFAKYGLIFGIYYMWIYYKGLRKLCSYHSLDTKIIITFYAIIQIALATQNNFFHAPFVMLFIIGLEQRIQNDYQLGKLSI